jgi:hypothetical protein
LDFLAGNLARNFPELLEFCKEFNCLENASRIDMQYIKDCILEVESNIWEIEKEVEKNKKMTTVKEDRYFDISFMFNNILFF